MNDSMNNKELVAVGHDFAKAAVKDRTRPEPVVSHTPQIAEVCRQNWQGYQIHKIFGSARV
ncbi:hypothetical protein [Lelliottia amnigena]|uniref:hypothetical protein n=1 Tax=Lelliottia amnigena TaxID=61646 RepID=UPI00293B8A97|nr:hypothetical protein [Lelliottia amnigena]